MMDNLGVTGAKSLPNAKRADFTCIRAVFPDALPREGTLWTLVSGITEGLAIQGTRRRPRGPLGLRDTGEMV